MKFLYIIFVCLLIAGCTQELTSDPRPDSANVQKPDIVSPSSEIIRGTLTDEGVLCQALRGENNTLYILENVPEGLIAGDRVQIERRQNETPLPSHCDQGEVLHWTSITVFRAGQAEKTWKQAR
ncbi:hypothetical protein [Litorimonas sp. WD9-15]|uniref:hypothetical protein n=1 Tax=Litorimonas sp. WD9-15 TaxID=3418716 RepID=UPI003D0803B8